jgi:lipopolysaccharide export system permease protein
MNLLHRHIFWSVLTTCLASVGLFAAVLILGNVLKDIMGYMLAGQIEPTTFLYLMGLLVPYVAAYALPMGMLAGVLLVLGRMSAQQEITAMRAAGLSLFYVARPVILLGVLATIGALVINFEFMPRARTAYKTILADAVQTNPLSFIVPRTFVRDFPNMVVYVEEKDGAELKDIWFWRLDDENRVVESGRAKSGEVTFDETAAALSVVMREVSAEARTEKDPEDFSKVRGTTTVGEVPLVFAVDDLFSQQKRRVKYKSMTLTQLVTERDRLYEAGDEVTGMKASLAISEKASTAVAVLAFAIMAVPLGIRVSRTETSANLGVALVLVMGYYFLTIIVSWLEAKPDLRPDLLMWLPAILFMSLGVWLFSRVERT